MATPKGCVRMDVAVNKSGNASRIFNADRKNVADEGGNTDYNTSEFALDFININHIKSDPVERALECRRKILDYDELCVASEQGRTPKAEERFDETYNFVCWYLLAGEGRNTLPGISEITARSDAFPTPCLVPIYYFWSDVKSATCRGYRSKLLHVIHYAISNRVPPDSFSSWLRSYGGLDAANTTAKRQMKHAGILDSISDERIGDPSELVKNLNKKVQETFLREQTRPPLFRLPSDMGGRGETYSIIFCKGVNAIGPIKIGQQDIARIVGRHGLDLPPNEDE